MEEVVALSSSTSSLEAAKEVEKKSSRSLKRNSSGHEKDGNENADSSVDLTVNPIVSDKKQRKSTVCFHFISIFS